jgi:predicted DNA-binding protein
MARPFKYKEKMVRYDMRISPEIMKRLDTLAKGEDRQLPDMIRIVIEKGLKAFRG